jgi:hypothetical protein
MTHNDFDNMVKDALNDIKHPYSSSDWELMNKKLDDDKRIRTRLYLFKGIEVFLTLASVWAIYQYVGTSLQPSPSVLPPHAIVSTNPSGTPNTTVQNTAIVPHTAASPQQNIQIEQPSIAPFTTPLRSSRPTPNTPTAHTASKTTKSPNPPLANQPQYVAYTTTPTNYNVEPAIPTASAQSTQTQTGSNHQPNAPVAHKNSQLYALPTLAANEIRTTTSVPTQQLSTHHAPIGKVIGEPIELKRQHQYRLGCFVSPDMNFVPQSVNLGFALGATATIGFSKRIELETGISYANKSFVYKRRGIPDQTGVMQYEEYQLRYANYHMASLPVNIQVNLNKSPNWRAYLATGATANFMLTADFLRFPGNSEPAPVEEGGLIQGGSFKNNFYTSADFGIGLERKLANNGHLYIQPSYRQALDATGPENHKIGSFSLVVGAKTNL